MLRDLGLKIIRGFVCACMHVHHISFFIYLLANFSKSESERVSPKITAGKFPILQIQYPYSAFSMCLHRRLDSVLANVGTLLRLYCLNIACLRETNFGRPLDEFKPKTPGQDCFLLTPKYQHSFIWSPLCSM